MATTDTVTPVDPATPSLAPEVTELKEPIDRYETINVKDIITKAGDNIRTGELPEIESLAKTIASVGQLAPILVTPSTETPGKYTVIAGFRRLTAVRSLGRTTISARIIDAVTNDRLRKALVENLQREDMAPLDIGKQLQRYLKDSGKEQQDVAEEIGKTPGYVSQHIALLNLPASVQSALRDGSILLTHARALCRLGSDVEMIEKLLPDAINITAADLDAKISFLLDKKKAEAPAEETDGEEKPKKAGKKARAVVSDTAIEYYVEADFHPLKKEDIRDLMVNYKRKEVNADSEAKRKEYHLILQGITLAADLRLK